VEGCWATSAMASGVGGYIGAVGSPEEDDEPGTVLIVK
jgi:hypothetical protein